jgi:hypothetical protein
MKRLFVVLLVLIASVSWAADVKISNLPEATTLADTDVFPVVAGSTTSKVQVTNLKTILATHDAITLSTNLGTNLLGLSTQQLTLDNQTANYVFAGPTTGSAAAPSFRALVAADIPSLVATYQPLNATLTALAAQTETEGSIQYYTAAATPAVLAKGTAYQLLNMNSGATAPTWTSTLGATGTRLTKIWATDLEITNAPTINGAALTTILQPLNDDLTTLSSGGTANCLWGEKSDSSGIECKTSINIQLDDSAAQFKSATASKGTLKFVQSSIDNGILLTQTPVVTGNATFTNDTVGAGTYKYVFKETDNVFTGANTLGDGGDDQRIVNRINATNERWSGNTIYFAQCAASMGFGQPAYIQSTGKPGLADADAAATMPAIGLVVVASTDADTPCTVLTHGVITDTDWNWTVGNMIYVADGDAGAVTATLADISDTNDVVQVVGIAVHADSIFVNPSLTTVVLE